MLYFARSVRLLSQNVCWHNHVTNIVGLNTTVSFNWLLSELSTILEHHMAYRCSVRRYGTVLYRYGGDLLQWYMEVLGSICIPGLHTCQLFKMECRDRPHPLRIQLSPHPFLHPGPSTEPTFAYYLRMRTGTTYEKFAHSATRNVMSRQNLD